MIARRGERRGQRTALLVMWCLALVIMSLQTTIANAASGSVSQLALKVTADGTAPFDGDSNPGNDESATNGIVRSRDTVTYEWTYTVSTPGDITFVQTATAGAWFDLVSTSQCKEGAAAISADKSTLTCTLANQPTGTATYHTVINAGLLGNAKTLSSVLSAGAVTSPVVSTQVSGLATFQVGVHSPGVGTATAVEGPYAGQGVATMNFSVEVMAPIPAGEKGLRGLEPLTNDFTVEVKMSGTAGAYQSMCRDLPAGISAPYNKIGVKPDATASNSLRDSGTISCSQTAPGENVRIRIQNADTSALTYPQVAFDNSALAFGPPSWAQVAGASFQVQVPLISGKSTYPMSAQVVNFDPQSAGGGSNYGAGVAPGQEPGATCKQPYCATVAVDTSATSWYSGLYAYADESSALIDPNQSRASNNHPLLPGQSFIADFAFSNRSASEMNGIQMCTVWDPSELQYGGAVFDQAKKALKVEYSNKVHADDSARRAENCGTFGDGQSGWYATPEAAGGPSKITAVRVVEVTPAPLPIGGVVERAVKLVRPAASTLPAGTGLGVWTHWAVASHGYVTPDPTYNPDTNTGTGAAGRVVAADARVRMQSMTVSAPQSKPRDTLTWTVQPTVSNPYASSGTAKDVTVTVSMPSPCLEYVAGSVTNATVRSFTLADLGADGVACTADDGKGIVLTLSLGDVPVNTALAPVTLQTDVSRSTPQPSSFTASAVISSPSDPSSAAATRTSSATTQINNANSFEVSHSVTAVKVQTGDQFTYKLGWVNATADNVGALKLVELLPYNGDARGSSGIGTLSVNKVTAGAGVVVEYTIDPAANVRSALALNAGGDQNITWTTTKPADPTKITAVRLTTPSLGSGAQGDATIDVSVTPVGTAPAVAVADMTSGQAGNGKTFAAIGKVSTTVTSAALTGRLYEDKNYDKSFTAGTDTTMAAKVTLSGYSFGVDGVDNGGAGKGDDVAVTSRDVTTAADGTYAFTGLHSGKYAVSYTTAAGYVISDPVANVIVAAESTAADNLGYWKDTVALSAVNDTTTVTSGATVTVPVLGNDAGDASKVITAVGTSTGGTATISADKQSVSFAAKANFAGATSFTYTITDKAGKTSTATVNVTVNAPAMTAANDTATVRSGQTVDVPALANDTGDGSQLITAVGTSTGGTATISADKKSVSFAAKAGFTGATSFTYTITDQFGQKATATVNVTVTAPPFVGITPARYADTRALPNDTFDHQSANGGKVSAGGELRVKIAGRGSVPAGVKSVVLNVTVTETAGWGYITAYACDAPRPNASNVNYSGAGETVPNGVTVTPNANGEVCFYSFAATHLIVDVAGYYPAGAAFDGVPPARLMDTRTGESTIDGQFAGQGRIAAGGQTKVKVAGRGGVAADAKAVALNFTSVNSSGSGWLTVWPCGQPKPTASSVNYSGGKVVANSVTVNPGTNGEVCIYAETPTDVIVDVTGYHRADSSYMSLVPVRYADTRGSGGPYSSLDNAEAKGKVAAGKTYELQVAGRGSIPADAGAVTLNVTVDQPSGWGYLTIYPCGESMPTASSVNYNAGQTVANGVTVKPGTGGKVCIYSYADVHLIVDAAGYHQK